jgi:DNA-binding beta-propeller fold protein YncE
MKMNAMKYGVVLASVLAVCGVLGLIAGPTATAQKAPGAPAYRYDPTWPNQLPNNWTMEPVTGMFVDKQDHIWVLNRPRDFDDKENAAAVNPPAGECCFAPPAVMEFDADGNLLSSWGIPDSVPGWPGSEHTIFTDRAGNVYIGGASAGDTLMKFSRDGKFISDFGHRGPSGPNAGQKQNNQQTDLLLRGVAAATLDEDARELYIADGYLNRRVIVFDLDTGKFKRGWGAYGVALSEIDNDPQPPHNPAGVAKQFKSPVHCVRIANDGLVYVCDRGGDRIQVFTKEGKFIKEFLIAYNTLRGGSAGSVDFSPDPQQKYIFVADIVNNVVWQLERDTGVIVGKIGHHGHSGGQFHFVHVAAMDSKGNLYTGEVDSGRRVQKFVPLQ